ncbi:hypothetical protein NAF17_07800 [Mucilaginibacter sp. RB4R14]|nr:hypothetical protein [Mucilaginibacter aurantiaciroseus]
MKRAAVSVVLNIAEVYREK